MSDAESASIPQTSEAEAPVQPSSIVPAECMAPAPLQVREIVGDEATPHLAQIQPCGPALPTIAEIKVMEVMARTIALSGKYPQLRDENQALTIMLVGHSLGISPIASINGIHIFDGKVALGSTLMLGIVQRTKRYRYIWRETTKERCKLTLWEEGHKDEGVTVEWTLEMAKEAGLYPNKNNWKNFTRQMLEARCASEAIRMRAAEVLLGGVYTPDELGATVEFTSDEREVVIEAPEALGLPQASVEETWSLSDEQGQKLVHFMTVAGWDKERQDREIAFAESSKREYWDVAYTVRRQLESEGKWEEANRPFAAPAPVEDGAENTSEEPPAPRPKPAVVTPLPVEQVVPADPDSPVPDGLTPQIFGQLSDAMDYLELPAERQKELMGRVLACAEDARQAAAAELLEALRLDIRARQHVEEQAEGQQSMFPEPPAHDKEPPSASRPGSASRSGSSGRRR